MGTSEWVHKLKNAPFQMKPLGVGALIMKQYSCVCVCPSVCLAVCLSVSNQLQEKLKTSSMDFYETLCEWSPPEYLFQVQPE